MSDFRGSSKYTQVNIYIPNWDQINSQLEIYLMHIYYSNTWYRFKFFPPPKAQNFPGKKVAVYLYLEVVVLIHQYGMSFCGTNQDWMV